MYKRVIAEGVKALPVTAGDEGIEVSPQQVVPCSNAGITPNTTFQRLPLIPV